IVLPRAATTTPTEKACPTDQGPVGISALGAISYDEELKLFSHFIGGCLS
ncbi:hypothetical protein STEG23_025806, partial [Scotinomys teguina]